MTDQEIDEVTHLNAMRASDHDPFSILGGRDACTVGARRARAADVDVSEKAVTHTPPRDPRRVLRLCSCRGRAVRLRVHFPTSDRKGPT